MRPIASNRANTPTKNNFAYSVTSARSEDIKVKQRIGDRPHVPKVKFLVVLVNKTLAKPLGCNLIFFILLKATDFKLTFKMKKLFLVLVLFCIVGNKTAIAQSVRVSFIRYKMITYDTYYSQWEKWPVKWSSSAAYAIISSVYDNTYKIAVYGNAGQHIVTSICTFNSQLTGQKRRSEGSPHLNCYTDQEGDQIWTNVVSLESLLGDVRSWKQDGAALYLWIFRSSSSFAFVFE